MPVSHVGVCVKDIAPAASFYAAALHPLGYRYIGSREDQLGFGVKEADFFISPFQGYASVGIAHSKVTTDQPTDRGTPAQYTLRLLHTTVSR